MYQVSPSKYFEKKYLKLAKNNRVLVKKIRNVVKTLKIDPFSPQLKTHKVDAKIGNNVCSSRVSGDIRIIWKFDENNEIVILLLDVGGHSGKNKVYR